MARKSNVTIVDIARVAGVSPQTVSRVINNKEDVSDATRQRIQELVDMMGYRPNRAAQGLVAQRNWTIGVVVSDITNPFFPEVIRGIQAVAREHDYNVTLYNSDTLDRRERQALQQLESDRAEGVIVHAPTLPSVELVDLLSRHRAAVIIGRALPLDIASVIHIDLPQGAFAATDYLIRHGRRHLAYIGHDTNNIYRPERFEGIQRALASHGIPPNHLRIATSLEKSHPGRTNARELLIAHPEIDGILCFNDLVGIGTLKACEELGRRVPEDVAVIGYDDIFFCEYCSPTLSSVRIPKAELGQQAAELLFAQINNQATQREITITPELVLRESTP